jgi:hypothetical protein
MNRVSVSLRTGLRQQQNPEIVAPVPLDLVGQRRVVLADERVQFRRQLAMGALERLDCVRGQARQEHGEAKRVTHALRCAERGNQLLFIVEDMRLGLPGDGGREQLLVPVLDLVAQADEELDVAAHRAAVLRVGLTHAARELPSLDLPVDALEAAIVSAVAKVDLVAHEPGVQQIQQGQMHVHHEPFEAAGTRRAVVEIHSECRLVLARLQDMPPLWTLRHLPMVGTAATRRLPGRTEIARAKALTLRRVTRRVGWLRSAQTRTHSGDRA